MGKPRKKILIIAGEPVLIYSRGQFADIVGVNIGTIYRWEKLGYVKPRFQDDKNRPWFTIGYMTFIKEMYDSKYDKSIWEQMWEQRNA
jgi:hypothetical protein